MMATRTRTGRVAAVTGLLVGLLATQAACDEPATRCGSGACEDAGPGDAASTDQLPLDHGTADRAVDAAASDLASDPDASSGDGAGQADAGQGDSSAAADAASATGWLYTEGNHIYRPDGGLWVGRGANIHDTRSCNACSWAAPDVAEVLRRIDTLVDDWNADFLRLDLESYAEASGRTHWQGVLDDPGYLADVEAIVAHVATKPGVYVMVSLWASDFFSELGWPTDHSRLEWQVLTEVFLDQPHVLFGVVNEPESNFSGTQDAEVWEAMNQTVATIRTVEDSASSPRHIVAVQGTGAWARRLGYYVSNPITAGSGENVAYEIHVYNPTSDFADMLTTPAQTLPVIIGEYGPANMSSDDCQNLMDLADQQGIPHLAWTFHMRCSPDLLVDNSSGGCGVDMPLQPTAWGQQLIDHLAP